MTTKMTKMLADQLQFTRKMSTPILHGGSKFRQGVLQLMIHSIDPLYEEPLSLALKNGGGGQAGELSKEHIHPPGAAYCPICGEEKHSMKLQMNANGVFHTAKAITAQNGNGNGNVGGDEALMATHANGDASRQISMVSVFVCHYTRYLKITTKIKLIFPYLHRRSPLPSHWTSPGRIRLENA